MTKVCLMVIVAIGIALSVIEWEVMLKTGGTTNILGWVGFIMIVGGWWDCGDGENGYHRNNNISARNSTDNLSSWEPVA